MSLARAFTKRVKRTDSTATDRSESPLPGRAASMRKDARPINRHEISLPVELLSTTNMLSYNAPDISSYRQTTESSSPSSSASSIKSSGSSNKESEHDSSMTDASSVDDSSSPTEPNHLSCYFNAAQSEEKQLRRSRSSGDFTTPKATASIDLSAPVVPTRALSHSKRAHEQVARQRSLRGMASTGSMRSLARSSSHSQRSSKDGAASTAVERSLSRSRSSAEQRTSIDMFSASKTEKDHPFGKELEQLDEVAEEFGNTVNDAETLEDVKIMAERGLRRFCAQEYLAEITPFADGFGMVSPMHVGMAWI